MNTGAEINLTRFTVLGSPRFSGNKYRCPTLCSCGTAGETICNKIGDRLYAFSCGCLNTEKVIESNKRRKSTHPAYRSKTYWIWVGMRGRCNNPNDAAFVYYGGRGITVCSRWLESFDNFYSDMGECPPSYTIERIDNNKGYFPKNCKWATRKEQMQNTRRRSELTVGDMTMSVTEWAEKTGVSRANIWSRLRRGKTSEQAIGVSK